MKVKKNYNLLTNQEFMTDKKYLIGRFVDYLCIFFPYKFNNLIIVPLERNNIKVHVARPQEYS